MASAAPRRVLRLVLAGGVVLVASACSGSNSNDGADGGTEAVDAGTDAAKVPRAADNPLELSSLRESANLIGKNSLTS